MSEKKSFLRKHLLSLVFPTGAALSLLFLMLFGLKNITSAEVTASHFMETNYAHDWVSVVGAGPNTAVTVTVAGKATVTGTTDGNGEFASDWFTWNPGRPDITPGDIITVANISGTLTVNPVGTITGVADYNADTVSGTVSAAWFSPTPLTINCVVWEAGGPTIVVNGVSPDGGSYLCDFTSTGWDLQPDQMLAVRYLEPDGDQITNVIEPPWVRVQAGHDWAGGNYDAGHTFWITVTDSVNVIKATAQITTQANGGWGGSGFQTEPQHWTPNQPDIAASDWVYFQADDGYVNSVRVGDISGSVDMDTDSISGTISANWFTQTLTVECHPWGGWNAGWNNAPVVGTSAAPDGSSPYSCQWNPITEWDVQPNQEIAVFYTIPGTRDLVGNVFQGAPTPGTRYVAVTGADNSDCKNPASPCATIQHAINQSVAGDEIRVAAGTYNEQFGMAIPLTIKGGYEAAGWTRNINTNPTIIDGTGTNGHLVHVQPGADLFFEGFTVQNANPPHAGGGFGIFTATVTISATIIQNNNALDAGAGLYVHAGQVTIDNSTLQNNSAGLDGGAVGSCCNSTITINNTSMLSNTAANGRGGGVSAEGTLQISNSIFRNNNASNYGGGINLHSGTHGLIQNTILDGNQAGSGGGLALELGSQTTFMNGEIRNNFTNGGAGGGIGVWDGSVLTLTHSIVRDNLTVSQGGGIHLAGMDDRATIINTLFAGNQANEGGTGMGIDNWGTVTLINSTIADNTCQTPGLCGGGVSGRTQQSNLTIINSILSGHAEGGLYCEGICNVSYSDVRDTLWPGAGNISADPLFVDAANGDYHILPGSPAADGGTPYNAPPNDLDGNPRDARPDMGAYETTHLNNDLAVIAAFPGALVIQGQQYAVQLTVYNAGNLPQTQFNAGCQITETTGGALVYSDTLPINIPGGLQSLQMTAVSLNPITLNTLGQYQLTCWQTLAGDERPQNDALTQLFDVIADAPDAWIRDNPNDNGDVPTDLNGWYGSPDIWVRHADDGGLIHQDPIAGQTNYVYARIHNRGTQPQDGTVDLTWIEPSLGARCGDWSPIGTIAYINLQPGETRILSIPWVPSRSGHTCLQALLDSAADPFNRDLECTPLWVPWDNNLGWRNINIFDNGAAAGPNALSVTAVSTTTADLTNVYNLPANVDLIIDRLTFPLSGEMIMELPQNLFDAWQANGGQGTGIEWITSTNQIRVTDAVSGTLTGIPMDAAQRETLVLQFTGPTGLEFELGLRERINGLVVGGIEYQWRIPDTAPPNVIGVTPANGTAGISTTTALTITFDEPVAPGSFNFTLTPTPAGNFTTTWNADHTAVIITHDGLDGGTSYTATLSAADGALNVMPLAFQWTFTTISYRIFLPFISR